MTNSGQSTQTLETSSLVAVTSWLRPPLFRMAPAWLVVAAAVASGSLSLQRHDMLRLLLCVLLADAAAGQLWQVLVSSPSRPIEDTGTAVAYRALLPYTGAGSLAARLGRWLAQRIGESGSGGAPAISHLVAAIGAVVVISLALGPLGIALAAAWMVLAVAAGLLTASERAQLLLLSAYEVALPWLLGYLAFGNGEGSVLALLLGIALVLLHSALLRREASRSARWAVRVAQIVLLACSVVARQPLSTLIVTVALLVPAAMQMSARRSESGLSWASYRHVTQLWWWLAVAAAAWAVGTVSGMAISVA